MISGVVNIAVETPFPAHNLTVALHGKEFCKFNKRVKKGKHTRTIRCRNDYSICNIGNQIMQLVDGPLPRGQYSYPFTLQLPEWLPASMGLGWPDFEIARLLIYYEIVAQFTP